MAEGETPVPGALEAVQQYDNTWRGGPRGRTISLIPSVGRSSTPAGQTLGA
jgi:hypothetical protein